jgi:uncharacterized protein (DUF433 family)
MVIGREVAASQGPRRHRSFRLPADILSRLDRRAQEARQTATSLAERYIDEGLRRDRHPGIVFVDGPSGRRPKVEGTGLDVWEVIETFKLERGSVKSTAAYFEIPERYVQAAARYYADYRQEIDFWIAENDRISAEEEQAAQRIRRALG